MNRSLLTIGTAIAALVAPSMASAATTVDVFAGANSAFGGGVGVATGLILSAGNTLTISASPSDLWASGELPRWSNANGQVGQLLATGSDESGQPVNTVIGVNGGLLDANGLSAPFGALVGSVGGTYYLLGTDLSTTVTTSGELLLYFWDTSPSDNIGSISVTAAIPEPATWAMMMVGFGVLGFGLRRRTATASRVSFKFA